MEYRKKGWKCRSNEIHRTLKNIRQPMGVYNYTKLGYTKMRAPEEVFKLIKQFWEKNKDKGKETVEEWDVGSTFTNHWDVPTLMLSVDDESLDGGGSLLRHHIWNAAHDTISEWTGQHLAETSLYGVRIYKDGAVLAPHVDRFPLVSSAIINVDQDVDEPWPLEVIGHDGVAVNITMVPGDLVLYESHSIIHGVRIKFVNGFTVFLDASSLTCNIPFYLKLLTASIPIERKVHGQHIYSL